MNLPCIVPLVLFSLLTHSTAKAAQGEMGTGVPSFGSYSAATGTQSVVWTLNDVTIPMAAGCSSLKLTPTTMGLENYRIAVATLLAAKLSSRRVRLYAHGPQDGDCGVDYVELQ